MKIEVAVEAGAGEAASFVDNAYTEAGAKIVTGSQVWDSPLIYKVNAPSNAEIAKIKEGTTLVSYLWPAQNPDLVKKLSEKIESMQRQIRREPQLNRQLEMNHEARAMKQQLAELKKQLEKWL